MANATIELNQVAHIRFGGRSFDVPLADLNLSNRYDEAVIRVQLAAFLEVTPRTLDAYVIDRHPNGNLTLRPEAVFG